MGNIDHPEHDELTFAIIGAAMRIRSKKGPGLLESAYHSFLCHELTKLSLEFRSQPILPATYDDVVVTEAYRPDIVVEQTVIIEVKAVDKLLSVHRAQLVTYLVEANLRTGLLFNFNEIPFRNGIRRISL
jgi:GxxExxY protein